MFKSISVLGTSSNSGKSWVATALCSWLSRSGLDVSPFKAQNMSNNSWVTPAGHEIGRAQGVQAEACGKIPTAAMNPILLKPCGELGSQLVWMGEPVRHLKARDYYLEVPSLWKKTKIILDDWKKRTGILVLEGAGSPVELNLMDRDLVNLRPIEHLDAKFILVGDIERGGVFAQIIGTWQLLPEWAKKKCLGFVVNKFRGDITLFSDAKEHFQKHLPSPFLGVLPYERDIRIENEDSLSSRVPHDSGCSDPVIAWIQLPRTSNSSDIQPWHDDTGISVGWVDEPARLSRARMIVLPGSKNTLYDLAWLKQNGLADAIIRHSGQGVLLIGICGGYQILGETIEDSEGVAGDAGALRGLGLLPVKTIFQRHKEVSLRQIIFGEETWEAYEIHMGQTSPLKRTPPLLHYRTPGGLVPEGVFQGKTIGSYLHGLFESPAFRSHLCHLAGIHSHRPAMFNHKTRRLSDYTKMASSLKRHLDLSPIKHYLDL